MFIISSCTKVDNYEAPNETLKGSVIDNITGKPILTEQPNGFRIKVVEKSWSENAQPEYFWGKPDGTFTNTKLFAGTYEITPVDGAFFDAVPQTINIKGINETTFTVTPYLNVTANVTVSGTSLTVSYKISRTQVGDKILDAAVFVSLNNPNVGTNVTDKTVRRDFMNIADTTILDSNYSETVSGLDSGKTYYVRVGARTNNPLKRYNFTEVFKIVIP